MGQVVAISDFRQRKLIKQLYAYERGRVPVIVATRSGAIRAAELRCYQGILEAINNSGETYIIAYEDVLNVTPINAACGAMPSTCDRYKSESTTVLFYPACSCRP